MKSKANINLNNCWNNPPNDGARLSEFRSKIRERVGGAHAVVGWLGTDVCHRARARKETREEGHGRRRAQGLEDVVTGEFAIDGVNYLEKAF